MLAKIISALALTLLLTGGALAYIPQPEDINAGQDVFAANSVLSEPQPQNIIYTGHSNSVQPQQSLETELFAANAVLSDPQPQQHLCGSSQQGTGAARFGDLAICGEPRAIRAAPV